MAMTLTSVKKMVVLLAAFGVTAASGGCVKSRKRPDGAGPACQACRENAKAPFCAANYIAPQASGSITVNGQKGCPGFDDPKLRASCENVLRCIHSTGCAEGNNPTVCLCGGVDMFACSRGAYAGVPTTGVCNDVYKAALEGGPPGTVIQLFGDAKSPIGVANNSYTCDVDANCPCGQDGQKKKEGAR